VQHGATRIRQSLQLVRPISESISAGRRQFRATRVQLEFLFGSPLSWVLDLKQSAPSFRKDGARLFRSIAAQRSN
jgi:hypothetical protein